MRVRGGDDAHGMGVLWFSGGVVGGVEREDEEVEMRGWGREGEEEGSEK
jgi:hypothetical protein